MILKPLKDWDCNQSQNYKIWKQFTTPYRWMPVIDALLSIIKLQNLKAIHNNLLIYIFTLIVVINHKTTKFESNSQLCSLYAFSKACCYQSQNYKIWKQFTTLFGRLKDAPLLLSITKLQNLKAIHNRNRLQLHRPPIVINHKTTKFESNSQQCHWKSMIRHCCYQSQNYKIWKQFTTAVEILANGIVVVINHKTTKFESNSQQFLFDSKTV